MPVPKDPEKYRILCEGHSRRLKERWKDPEFRASQEKIYQDPEWIKKRSEQTKRQFSKPAVQKIWSERTKKQWKDPKARKVLMDALSAPDVLKARSERARAQMLRQWQDPEYHKVAVEKRRKQFQDPEFQKVRIKAVSRKMLEQWQDPEYRERTIKRMLSIRSPNKKELLLASILHKLNLPYKFVGDGKLIIDGKNPDFANVDGQKKLIELYGEHFHREEKAENGGDEGKARKDFFQQFGYQTLIVWERELENKEVLIKKLIAFEEI